MGKRIKRYTEIYDNFMNNMYKLDKIEVFASILTFNEIKKSEWTYNELIKNPDEEKMNKILGMTHGITFPTTELNSFLKTEINYKNNISELMPFIRNQILIFSVSLYDFYIMDLVYNYHYEYQLFLKNSNKNLNYKEIFEYKNIDEVFEKIILKEIDSLGHMTYDDMISYIKNVLNLSLQNYEKINDKIIEIREIRNILIHNNGKINSQFIKKIQDKKYYINQKIELNEGLLLQYRKTIIKAVELIDREAKTKLFQNRITSSIYFN